jgi:hypothetical protein
MVLRGWLVPKRVLTDALAVHADRLADKDQVIAQISAERDAWKGAYQAEAQTNSTLAAQNGELMEGARLAQHIADSIPRTNQRRPSARD